VTLKKKYHLRDVPLLNTTEIILKNFEREKPMPKLPTHKPAASLPLTNQIRYVEPSVVVDESLEPNDPVPTQSELVEPAIGTQTETGDPQGGDDFLNSTSTGPAVIEEPTVTEKVFEFVEQRPEFPGGEKELMKYITKNLKFPEMAKEINTSGTVVVKFVVSKTGTVENVMIVRSPSTLFNQAAIDVFKNMPQWKPGKMNGRAVSVYFTIPIKFQLL
jgi:protein TonB